MNKLVRVLSGLMAIILVLYMVVIFIVPPIVDKKFNTSTLQPPYKVSEKAQTLYNSLPFIADLHCDALLWDRDLQERHDYGHVDIPRMLEANMSLQAFTIVSKVPETVVTKNPKEENFKDNKADSDIITPIYLVEGRPIKSWFNLKERALVQCEQLYDFESESFRVITSSSGLEKFIADKNATKNITAGYLGVEGMQVLEGELSNVDVMFDAGIRMMAPTHFFDNELGGSAHGMSKSGLTEFGKQVINKMEEKSMIVDLAHASPQLINDVLEMATKPVIVSHTGVKGTCDNVRNLSDDHLKKIAGAGGLIGIAFFEPAVCGTDAAATAKAIKYTADLVGIDHVALGSDFDGAIAMHFDVTGLPLLVEALLELNFTDTEIAKIMGGNTCDFLLKYLPE
ncbi:MAG: peptidase M19 [Bacteroidetes bacterium]|nr:MAG: peptidase M19 [Bacteroidota bacterium]